MIDPQIKIAVLSDLLVQMTLERDQARQQARAVRDEIKTEMDALIAQVVELGGKPPKKAATSAGRGRGRRPG